MEAEVKNQSAEEDVVIKELSLSKDSEDLIFEYLQSDYPDLTAEDFKTYW